MDPKFIIQRIIIDHGSLRCCVNSFIDICFIMVHLFYNSGLWGNAFRGILSWNVLSGHWEKFEIRVSTLIVPSSRVQSCWLHPNIPDESSSTGWVDCAQSWRNTGLSKDSRGKFLFTWMMLGAQIADKVDEQCPSALERHDHVEKYSNSSFELCMCSPKDAAILMMDNINWLCLYWS